MRTLLLLLLSAAVVHADAPDVTNPLTSAKIGAAARYSFELQTASRHDVGFLEVALDRRDATRVHLTEALHLGQAGVTRSTRRYPLERSMLAHVKRMYALQGYGDLRVESSKVTRDRTHRIDGVSHRCTRLEIAFRATWQGSKVRGDLVYDIDPAVGPLGIVVFRADLVYELEPDKWAQLQRLQLRLAPKPKDKPKD